jgi:RNA polymerase subunit RPABC4/transcription elongation factor Spt4
MPKKIKIVGDDGSVLSDSEIEEYKEEDISDDEELRRRRRRNKRNGEQNKPKIIDDTFMPSSNRRMRACLYCKLVLNQEKWNKLKMCPNCPESFGGNDETTDNFESIISLVLPMKSWVAEW